MSKLIGEPVKVYQNRDSMFSDVQKKCGQVLFREGWLIVRGKVQRRSIKSISIIAEDLSPLNIASKLRK